MATNGNGGRKPGKMFGPVGGLGKRFAILNRNKFYTVENLFQGIKERMEGLSEEDRRIGSKAFDGAQKRGWDVLSNPEEVAAAAKLTQVVSKTVTDDNFQEIVKDMQGGAIVEEVEYDDIETNITDDGVEDVIYVGGKTQSIYTPKKRKEEARRVFWARARSIKEEDDEGADLTKGTMDQESLMFGTEWNPDSPADGPGEGNEQGWGGNTLGDRGWSNPRHRVDGEKDIKVDNRYTGVTDSGDESPSPVANTPKKKKGVSGSTKGKKRAARKQADESGDEYPHKEGMDQDGPVEKAKGDRKVGFLGTKNNMVAVLVPKNKMDEDRHSQTLYRELDTNMENAETEQEDNEMEDTRTDIASAKTKGMNTSKHAPAEENPEQTELSRSQEEEYAIAADRDRKEREDQKTHGMELDKEDPKNGKGEGKEGVKMSKWDSILGEGWKEDEREVEWGTYAMFLVRILGDMKNVEGKRAGNVVPKSNRERGKMTDTMKEVARGIGKIFDKLGKWEEDRKNVMTANLDAIKGWFEDEEGRKKSDKETSRKQMETSIAIMAAKGGFASKAEKARAAEMEKKRVAEERKEEQTKRKSCDLNRIGTEKRKQEEERESRERTLRIAHQDIEVWEAELRALEGQITSLSG